MKALYKSTSFTFFLHCWDWRQQDRPYLKFQSPLSQFVTMSVLYRLWDIQRQIMTCSWNLGGVIQCHSKWHHSTGRIEFLTGVPRSWPIVSFPRQSEVLVKITVFCIPPAFDVPPLRGTSSEFRRNISCAKKLEWWGYQWTKLEDTFNRFDKIHARTWQTQTLHYIVGYRPRYA